MYKVLGVFCAVAAIALGTSVLTAVVQRSDYAKESKQIDTLKTEQATNTRELGTLHAELQRLGHNHTTSQLELGPVTWLSLQLRSAD